MSKEGFLKDYVEVNVRIEKFYGKYPEGSIQTEIAHLDDQKVIIKAYVYRTPDDPRPATGHAMEKEGTTYINKTSHLENCETSAVGRALAMMGFEVKKSVASREEVENAIRQQGAGNTPQNPRQTTKPAATELKCQKCGATVTKAVQTYCDMYFDGLYCPKCQKEAPRKQKGKGA